MSAATEALGPLLGWRAKAPSKAAALRGLLSDGKWHSSVIMERIAGQRFGARLFDLHNSIDMETGATPLHYRKRFVGDDDSHVQYQQTDKAACDICCAESRKRPAQIIAELQAENRALREENARLRGQR
jgi:hypothetical protein